MYELQIVVRTNTDPHGLLYLINEDIKDHVKVLSINYSVISPRPTTNEHHGGNQEDEQGLVNT